MSVFLNNKINSVYIEGWRGIHHSYAIITKHIVKYLLNKNIKVYFKDIEFPGQCKYKWKKVKDIIMDKLTCPNDKVDITIRISFPYNLEPCYISKKLIIFGTCECLYSSSDYYINKNLYNNNNTYILTPSEYSKEGFIRSNFNESNIFVIPHGIDYDVFINLNENNKLLIKNKYNINENDIVLLNIGAGTQNKNINDILEIFSILRNKFSNLKLILKISKTLYGNNIDNLLKKYGNKNIVCIYDRLTTYEIQTLYEISDIYLSPYKAEGFNLPVLEAMSHGIIPVVTENGPTDEFCNCNLVFKIKSKFNILNSFLINKRIYHAIELIPDKQDFLNKTIEAINLHKSNVNINLLKTYCKEKYDNLILGDKLLEYLNKLLYYVDYSKSKSSQETPLPISNIVFGSSAALCAGTCIISDKS